MPLRIATWNINSLRLRLPLLRELIAALDPEVICLQETKVPDALFPTEAPGALGYPFVAFRGMKGYNGVAVLSRVPFAVQDDAPDWCSKGDCRHLAVLLDVAGGPALLHNFYVPAGGDIPDPDVNPKFAHKLGFVAETTRWFAERPPPGRTILVGDLNIAPLETDVWSHKQLLNVISHTPVEVDRLDRLQRAGGFVDAVRHFVPPQDRLYTWWSYRARDWAASDRGRRLDHIWVTPSLVGALTEARVHRDSRGWVQASDHVPVMVEVGS